MLNERLPVGFSLDPSRQDSGVLTRLSQAPFYSNSVMTSFQSQVDGLVSHFVDEAANPTTLAALMAGGMAYRVGRIGILAAGEGRVAAAPLRALSVGLGLGTEVGAFEFTSRALSGDRNPNRWNWSGQGGWAQGLTTSAITFGMLKGAGFLAREQNLVFQHAFQGTAMVAGHNTAGILGLAERPERSLAEQFLHAEATNIQLGAGTSLVHAIAPGIYALERGLDLSIQSHVGVESPRPPVENASLWPLATAEAGPQGDGRAMGEPPLSRPEKNPNFILMSANQGNGGDEGNKPPAGGVRGEFYTRPEPDEGASQKSSTEILRHSLEMSWGDLLRLYPHGLGVFRLSRGEGVFRLVMANERLGEMFGYTFEEASEKILRDFIHPEDVGQFREKFSNLPSSDKFKVEGLRIIKKDGTVLSCDANVGMGVFDNHHLLFAFLEDVTEKKTNLEALRASEAHTRALINAIPDAIYRVNMDGVFLDVHEGQEAILVLPREELLATRLANLNLPPEIVKLGLDTLAKALQEGSAPSVEFDLPRPDGVHHQEARVVRSGPDEVVGIVRDITEKRKAQERLQQVSQVVENSPNLVSMATPDGRIFYINKAVKRLAGLPSDADLSLFPTLNVRDVHPTPSWQRIIREGLPTAHREGLWEGETELQIPGGRKIPVHQIILAHKTSSGELAYFSTILRDLTDERKAQDSLLVQTRLTMAEMLGKGVAHDINNPLTYIVNILPMIIRQMEKGEAPSGLSGTMKMLENLQRQVDRIEEIVQDFKDLSGRPELGNPFEIQSVLQERDIRDILGEDWEGQLSVQLSDQNLKTNMTPKKFKRVLQNLVTNARKAMKGRESQQLTIEASSEELSAEALLNLIENSPELPLKPGRFIRISVSDTGKGMDKETQSHIFEPYFTTGDLSTNMGMGLTLTRKFVQDVGGFVVVRSTVGRGTTFDIYLPRVDSPPSS